MKTTPAILITAFVYVPSLCTLCSGRAISVNAAGGADFGSIQAAISDSATLDGDQIQVAPGTYLEGGVIDFAGKAVRLYSSDGPETTIIDGNNQHRVIQCISGEDPNTTLEGFTIRYGYADKGAGMYNENSSPTVTNCVFYKNSTCNGGDERDPSENGGGGAGLYNYNACPMVSHCVFQQNVTGHGGRGKAGYNEWLFINSPGEAGGHGGNGAGMYNDSSSPTVSYCHFVENITGDGGEGGRGEDGAVGQVGAIDGGDGGTGGEGGYGAGMYNCHNSSAVVEHCTFAENRTGTGGIGGNYGLGGIQVIAVYNTVSYSKAADGNGGAGGRGGFGAGVFNQDSSPAVRYCTFQKNLTGRGGHSVYGLNKVDILLEISYMLTLIGTDFDSGGLKGCGGGGGNGAGMCNFSGSPTLVFCNFGQNETGACGRGRGETPYDHLGSGAGIYNKDCSGPVIANCTFSGNQALCGGGISNSNSNPEMTHCIFKQNQASQNGGGIHNSNSSPTTTNCLFRENKAYRNGGGVLNLQSHPVVTNCTFLGNSVSYDGAGFYNQDSHPVVTNCILWDSAIREIYSSQSTPIITYSDIQGGFTGTGNINFDPVFADADGRLQSGSPCVGMGNGGVSGLPARDLDDNPRILGVVDMGAFECTQLRVYNVTQDLFYEKIQSAIDAAGSDDEIRLPPGTYMESIDLKGKAIHLFSAEGPQVTTLDGTGHSHVVQCVSGEGPNTIIEGFTIQGGSASEDIYDNFDDGNYQGWTIVDQGNRYPPSSWSAATGVMRQSSNIASLPETVEMPGTYALWGFGKDLRDYHVEGTLRSTDNDYLGIMFRYQDANNYYRFSWGKDKRFYYRMLGKMKNGVFTVLSHEDTAYVPYATYAFKVSAAGSNLQVYIDGQLKLSATDGDFDRGSIALYSWGNEGSEFDNIHVWMETPSLLETCGGGMFNIGSSPSVRNCIFRNNLASEYGGAMFNMDQSSPVVTDCQFLENTSILTGGAVCNQSDSHPAFIRCMFSDNMAGNGGGMYNVQSSPGLSECLFSGNIAVTYGGGMVNVDNSDPSLSNCTFGDNTASAGGGMYNAAITTTPVITNSIVWGNVPNGITNMDGAEPAAAFSDIQDGIGQSWFGLGCIDTDPLFAGPMNHDYRLLSSSSPCVDAGSMDAELAETDLEGNVRVLDGDLDGNAVVDMGACELNGCVQNSMRMRWYSRIQAAINEADNGDYITVQPGTYYENINFSGKGITLTSLNPDDATVVEQTIIDGQMAGSVVVFNSQESPNCVLAGFTLTHGLASPAINSSHGGAGIYCFQSSPVIRNCIIRDNLAIVRPGSAIDCVAAAPQISGCSIMNNTSGGIPGGTVVFESGSHAAMQDCTVQGNYTLENGGILCSGSSPVISGCIVSGNNCRSYQGGGVTCINSNAVVQDCAIDGNLAGSAGGNGEGGGIYCSGGSPTIQRCSISNNSSTLAGGGILGCQGTIRECQITGNSSRRAGGGLSECTGSIVNCVISGNQSYDAAGLFGCSSIVNCAIVNNTAERYGGGLNGCSNIVNCTIAANRVLEAYHAIGGGLIYCSGISNSIIWSNYALTADSQLSSCTAPSYSCIQGWAGGGTANTAADPGFRIPGHWVHDTDPNLLVEPNDPNAIWSGGNYRLNPGSPCIDRANNSAVPGSLTMDLNGWSRFIDDVFTADGGLGTAPIADMGAFEFLQADIDGSGSVNFSDLWIFASHWAGSVEDCSFIDDFAADSSGSYTYENSTGNGGSFAVSGGKLNIFNGSDNTACAATSAAVNYPLGATLSLDVPPVYAYHDAFMLCSTRAGQPDGISSFGFLFRRDSGGLYVRIQLCPGGILANMPDPDSSKTATLNVTRTSDTTFDYSITIDGIQTNLGSFTLTQLAGTHDVHIGAQGWGWSAGTFVFDNLRIYTYGHAGGANFNKDGNVDLADLQELSQWWLAGI